MIDLPIATNVGAMLRNNNLTELPLITMPSATNVNSFAEENNLDTVPALSIPSATNCERMFQNNGVISLFAMRNFYAMSNGINMFNGTTLPTVDYSDILITQRANNVTTGTTFNGGSSTYNVAGGTARGELVSIQSWTITDGGAA